MKYIKTSELAKLRQELLEQQNYICPITKSELLFENSVVDHQHVFSKAEILGQNGSGMIRGVIDRFANMLLGKIENSFQRTGLRNNGYHLPDLLRAMADYIENNQTEYLHPSEMPKPKKITKTSFNTLLKKLKETNYSKKLPEYPKSGTLTKPLEELFNANGIEILYYG